MSSVGKRWSKAGVVCPSPGHGGSRVRFTGLIRACLEANRGRPNLARRAVIDVGRIASLR